MAVDDLEYGTKLKDHRGSHEGPPPSEARSNGPNEEAAEEGARLKYTDGIGIHRCGLSVGVPKVCLEGG